MPTSVSMKNKPLAMPMATPAPTIVAAVEIRSLCAELARSASTTWAGLAQAHALKNGNDSPGGQPSSGSRRVLLPFHWVTRTRDGQQDKRADLFHSRAVLIEEDPGVEFPARPGYCDTGYA